ncbi:MAG TPA: anti-anti-sigma factor [Cyanobacteria bacterium UBA11149]|nr:anti-anti-sigma factor [Cyanobacteria bacterium UBA11366]HBK64095.1 anti-anti-sigma factor [Cyanobacteria bacterium UBA11166]HBR76307.1 anti-anti-sigma factor [Cyanobacteria bacterium UBA11159]HBS71472.1 anti-anti-sigma factor [Cyanobacteria bacterium UBA11153]HBW87614.1 anti-anti-sigma factor [Cyanobacteria bacterium UBA11149]HCA96671.1 anti-anti-sigma factor [Cyanobacteria bacterium UBA9226]
MAVKIGDSGLNIIQLSGQIDLSNSVEIKRQIAKAIVSKQYAAILVDMERVESIDSEGLLMLVAAFRHAQKRQLRLSICSIAPSIRMVFELTQVDRVFEIFENRHAFAKSLKPREQVLQLIA